MDRLHINWENMNEFSQVPIEYRFIDKVDVVPGVEATGIKAVSSLDWYFKIHFPGNPIVPGVFLMEAMQQTGLFIITTLPETKEKLMLFQGCKNMRMYKSVRPGDIIKTDVQLKAYRNGIADFDGKLYIQDGEKETLACAMTFTQIVRSQLPQIKAPEAAAKINVEERGGVIDWQDMETYLSNTGDFRFVDKVKVIPGQTAVGVKLASSQDWYYGVSTPGDLFMPSSVMIEAIIQTGVFTVTTMPEKPSRLMLFHGCESAEFFGTIRPGDIAVMETHLNSCKHGIAKMCGTLRKYPQIKYLVGRLECTLISPDQLGRVPVRQ